MTVSVPNSESLFSLLLSFRVILAALPFLLLFSMGIAFVALEAKGLKRVCIDVCINLPVVFPPIGTGFLLVYLFGSEGVVGRNIGLDLMFTFPGLVVAAFITGVPFVAQTIIAGIDRGVVKLCEASYTMGKGRFETFARIVLPLLRAHIVTGTLLASARILGEVGISLMIGGNIVGKTNTISLEIYNAVLDGEHDRALMLSLFLIVFSSAVFGAIKLLNRRNA